MTKWIQEMAGKKSVPYREYEAELSRQIAERSFRHVTLICGEQDLLRSENARRLRAAVLGDGDPMNSSVLRGAQATATRIIDLSETLPFFSENRVITAEESSLFARGGEEADRLSAYLGHIPETSYLIFVEPSPNAGCKLYKTIAKTGFICRCDTPDDGYLHRWAGTLFREAGLQISPEVLNLFLENAGKDMLSIRSESEKLIGYCMDRGSVTQEDVRTIGTPAVQDRIFEMISAITNRRQDEALAVYMELRRLRTAPQVILALMLRQYLQLLQAGELLQTMSEKEVAAALKVSPWVLSNRLRPALRGATRAGLENAVEACVRADQRYKSGRIAADAAVEELIVIFSAQR